MRTAILLAVLLPTAAIADVGVNVYGLSHHFDEAEAQRLGLDNELNPGLGLRWRRDAARHQLFVDLGAYRDSGEATAKYAAIGMLWKATNHVRLGAALAVMHSATYNRGEAFAAPLPVVAYDFGRVTLNLTYMPRIVKVNDLETVGLWLTIWTDRP